MLSFPSWTPDRVGPVSLFSVGGEGSGNQALSFFRSQVLGKNVNSDLTGPLVVRFGTFPQAGRPGRILLANGLHE